MQKRFDNIFSFLMLVAGVGVVLVGWWRLSNSIARMGPVFTPAAPIYIKPSAPELEATPEPTPTVPLYSYDPDIPLSPELQTALHEVCGETSVPEALVLGVIETESGFQTDADNGQCYGLMQLNKDYFPADLSPAENIRAGVTYLGQCLERYRGNVPAALTAYNAGHDTGYRGYAQAVLAAAVRWDGLD